MQQTCSQCGFVSPVPSKFCRQCGAALFAESESSEASTRNYGRQTPAPVPETPPTSHPFTSPTPQPPPSMADAFAPETMRLQNQPQMPYGQPPTPMGMPPVSPAYPAPPAKSNWWKWLLGFALVTLLVCGGLIGYVFMRANQIARDIQREINQPGVEGGVPGGVPGGPPPPPGAPQPPPPPGTAPEFEKLTYPNAKITSRVSAFGQQVMEMKTTDTLAQVKEFYVKQMGAPVVESDDGNDKALVFQKPPLMVTVGADRKAPGQNSITIIRSGWIPKIDKPEKYQ
jgi:hypothetical protein